jgi:thioesterase domain-containing protein
VGEVLRMQPDGPYLFAAQSGGCYVALEMGRQMAALGREVAAVVLMAPALQPIAKQMPEVIFDATARKLLDDLNATIDGPPDARLDPAQERRLRKYGTPDKEIKAGVKRGDKHALRIMRAVLINRWAYGYYGQALHRQQRSYHGRVVLMLPHHDPAAWYRKTVEQWRTALPREPEVVDVPAKHSTVLDGESAGVIGGWFSAEIEKWRRA